MSFWLMEAPYQQFRSSPALPQRAQAVVIGGGITGLSAAYWLRRYGVEVVLLEARGVSGGATGRNGGHLVSGPAVEYAEAIRRYGLETARALYQFTLDTVAAIQNFVTEHHIDCDLRMNGTVILALTDDELKGLEETARLLAKDGLPVAWWDAAECAKRTHSASFRGGLFNPKAGHLWPAKLVFGLAEHALRLGGSIHTQTAVQTVRREANNLMVQTECGTIRAEAVIYATNAWTRSLLPDLAQTIIPVRGQVILTKPAPALWPFGLVTDFGFEYFIQRPDGRIVLGGMRPKSTTLEVNNDDDATLHPGVSAGLREFLPQHFPALAGVEVEQEWTGIMGWTPDLNPLVGPLPGRPGEFIAAGYSGHGMPITFSAGQAVAAMIAGRPPEGFVEAFLPARYLK